MDHRIGDYTNAHWIDPTTLELIERSLDRMSDSQVLLLLTSRPDKQPELVSRPHVTRITVDRLRRANVQAIVMRLGGEQLPALPSLDQCPEGLVRALA